jgi:hypothetical protein
LVRTMDGAGEPSGIAGKTRPLPGATGRLRGSQDAQWLRLLRISREEPLA